MLQRSGGTVGFIEPCLPSPAEQPPTGANWLHEIKHNGFRILALRDAKGVRLYTRNRYDFAVVFPDRGGGRGAARTLVPDRWRGHCLRRRHWGSRSLI